MLLELNDICFFVRSIKLISSDSNISFNILNYTQFSQNQTRSTSFSKLVRPLVKNRDKQLYFNRLTYLWNSLPPIDLSLSLTTIKSKLHVMDIFWDSFTRFNPDNYCTYFYSCPCHTYFSQPKSCFSV